MSGSGKGGEQKTTIELPEDIEKAAKDNLKLAEKVGSLPYAPYFGASVAGFTPAQEAAFKGADMAASAFGLPGAAAGTMPKPDVKAGGFSGYSTKPFYEQAMSQVPPEVLQLYNSFFFPNNGANKPPVATKQSSIAPFKGQPI